MRIEAEPGAELAVRHREGAGQAFLLVHGLSSNALLWGETAGHLGGHPSYAVDLRSHGLSSVPDSGYDTATAAADLAVVIETLGLERPIVVGQSWGGNVVTRLAAKHPELVGAIGLVDGGWIDLPAVFSDWEECRKALRPPDMSDVHVDKLRSWITKSHPDWSEQAVEATVGNFHVNADGMLGRRLSIEHHLQILRSMWDGPPWEDLPLITAPVLMLPALAPTDPKAERVSKAASLCANARITWYPQSDHDLHAQHPERLASDLLTLVEPR
ncbi:alpha/beta fold hydrolase [Catelliglobosispora koreensis]|uniref:alpha/beta fold hydrolase n=1 Tax=Catelliglobosispora koreensis TaxID=129052 RepID=UPI0003645C62|nr:alpha/beta hydrolase [Catelliglobosispora koreensis]